MPPTEHDYLELVSDALEGGGRPVLDRVKTAEEWELCRAALQQWVERVTLEWQQDELVVEDCAGADMARVTVDDPRDYHW